MTRRGFGAIRRLPSGRYQAHYTGPDTRKHLAPVTFDTRLDAEAWLTDRRRTISGGTWTPPGAPPTGGTTFGVYAADWLPGRDLKPRTRELYGRLLEQRLLPTFADTPLTAITPPMVRSWYTGMGTGTPTARAHAYGLLRTILGSAVADDVIGANPCRIRGAGSSKRVRRVQPATLPELAALVDAMPEKYRPMVLLSSWCGLRFGEAAELRAKDVDLHAGTVRVERAVARISGQSVVGTPKSDAGVRTVAIPPHLIPVLAAHLEHHLGADALLFPAADGDHLSPSSLYRPWNAARVAAGRPDLRWHDLRHTGAVLAAATGATLAELMARLGHSTPGAALRYQHAAEGRDQQIAKALSALAEHS